MNYKIMLCDVCYMLRVMDITILKKLNLSDKEIKVYLKLLECGTLSVRNLAELTNLNRGTAYDILKRLKERSLVSHYHQETKQKFVAEEPDKLIKLIEEQEDELKKARHNITDIIPELKSLQNKEGHRPITKLYEGRQGVRLILEDVLNTMAREKNKEYYVYSATNASDDINNAYPDFTKARIRKKIKVKAVALAPGGETHGLDERRWLGTNQESATYILIYTNRCAFISRDANGSPVGVIIENKMIYETQKTIFLQLWKLLKDNK